MARTSFDKEWKDWIRLNVDRGCPKDELLIKLDQSGNPGNLDGFLYPFDLLVRFSLGVVL